MARLKSAWDKLSMRDRALFIRLGVDNGVSSLKLIRDTYNLYSSGGDLGAYNTFVETLPDNMKHTDTAKYDMYRYWELNGRPKDFEEAKQREMFHKESDGYYHASTLAEVTNSPDKHYGTLEFIKAKNHNTIGLEVGAYLKDKNHPMRNREYILDYIEDKARYRPRTYAESILPEGAYVGTIPVTALYATGGNLAHKKSGEELGENQDLNYPNLLPEVVATPKWYELEWAKRTAAGLGAFGTIATYVPNPYAKVAGVVAQIPDVYYDTRGLISDIKNVNNWVDEGLNALILDPFIRKKRPLIERLGKGVDYLGPFKKINIPLSALDAVNDGYYAITGNKLSKDVLSLVDNKKSTGGPLYPFSFEKNPFLKTPVVRYDEGGQKQDASNPGGYTDEQLNKNYLIWKTYDPTGGLGFFNYVASQNSGNLARGEENEYWKEYLGLDSAVPLMNSNAYTEWDKQIEGEKKQNGELTSDFYGTTPRMDYNILALADTLMLGNMVRNYTEYDKTYDLPHIETVTEAYELAKNILNNPNQWTLVNGEIPIGRYRYNSKTSETNPLGMLSHFGMKWVPEENALYMHDTYDFPNRVHILTDIPVRPREMKIRSKINFDPTKGSWLLRSPVNYNTKLPVTITK